MCLALLYGIAKEITVPVAGSSTTTKFAQPMPAAAVATAPWRSILGSTTGLFMVFAKRMDAMNVSKHAGRRSGPKRHERQSNCVPHRRRRRVPISSEEADHDGNGAACWRWWSVCGMQRGRRSTAGKKK